MPGSVQTQVSRAVRTASCRRRRRAARGRGWKPRRKRSAVARREGASMMSTVMISGQIDDLSTMEGTLPEGEEPPVAPVPRHQSSHFGAHHLQLITISHHYTPLMDEFSYKTAEISPEYLLGLSKQVDVVSRHWQHLRLGSLTQDFSNTLTAEFNDLSQYLSLYRDDPLMRASSLLHCKGRLELYTLGRTAVAIGRENGELSNIISSCIAQLREVLDGCEGLVLEERRAQGRLMESQKDKVIARLRREVAIKREYTGELEERVRELQDENSQLYSKLISAAKQTSDFAIRGSPAKIKQLLTATQLSQQERPASPRKKVSARSYQQEVIEVLESKFRQESIQERHSTLDEYLRTYFTMKYGKPLADQNEASFRQAVSLLARAQERHIFLLFQAILEGLCEEGYFFQDRQVHERIAKCLKRYLHEKYGRPQHQLDKLLDWRNLDDKGDLPLAESDLQPILSNVYKSTQVHTLQLILSEVISAKSVEKGLTCRRLLAEILNYELSKHLLRVQDIVREARRVADGSSVLSYEQVQQVMVRVVKDKNRYPLLMRHANEWTGKKFTISQVIEVIERIRRAKMPPRD